MFLSTQRMILRKLEETDFADYVAYAADEETCRMLGNDPFTDAASARPNFDWLVHKEPRCYALALKETGQVIGNVTVTAVPKNLAARKEIADKRGVSLSFALSRAHRRKGLMQEALIALIAELFEEEHLDYIQCGYFDFNMASAALQHKLGFTFLCTDSFEMNGERFTTQENVLYNPQA